MLANRLLSRGLALIFSCAFLSANVCKSGFAGVEPVRKDLAKRLIEFRRDLHEHPELGNREVRTMRQIAQYLKTLGLSDIRVNVAKTGVVAVLKGGQSGPTVALRTPIDAFPIQEKNNVPYKSQVPNVSHACGHDAMTAMVLGAAEILSARRDQLKGKVEFIFQPAEEGFPEGEEGGALLMIKEGVLNQVAAVLALHVDSDIPFGQAGLHSAAVYAADDDLEIAVKGASAHGATPWKGVDSIAIAGQILSGLQMIASRQTDIWDPIVLTIGTISAGTRPNAVAAEAKFTGTLRTYSAERRKMARDSIARIAGKIAEAFGAQARVRTIDETPPTVNDARLVKLLRPVLEEDLGASNVMTPRPMPYSDDFAFMAQKVPSLYFQIGIRNDGKGITAGTHTENFDVDENAIPLGAQLLADMAVKTLNR